ncbi:hypothetical protein KIH39_08170 [Telmatocola sphagniphila]|uniref:HTH IS21-type domain-containing protein n=1 Tax=Telmatocola sphagniphila TaxID=1123043 RepID=A0A8E6B8J7_9BACT|nr:hypothetical protein [Telmatocola sphagniphila]QVL33868.1 hypothetical protein KIH39_08170 [Telmatocola sphagniphila]
MVKVDEYARIRQAHRIDKMGIRALARTFHHSRRKIRQILDEPEPKPYQRRAMPSLLDSFTAIIEEILRSDREAPRKQRHTVAYYEQGNPEYRRLIAELEGLTVSSAEDKLFKGNALALHYPADGLRLIDQALAVRPSTLGHLLRADARSELSQVVGDVASAEDAVSSTELAKQLLPDNPARLGKNCTAHLTAMAAYERAGNSTKGAEHLTTAAADAAKMARFERNPTAILYRYDVAAIIDGLEGKLDRTSELRAARSGRHDLLLTIYEADNWLALGNDQEAEKVASELPSSGTGSLRVLAALGRIDGRTVALNAIDRYAGPDSKWKARYTAAPFLFALDRARCSTLLKPLLQENDPIARPDELAESKRNLSMLAGTISESDLLSAPARGPVELCNRQYFVAWKRMGEGDREGAIKAFEECYRYKLVDHAAWVHARIILIRMKDPNWPQALLTKKH